MKSKRLKSQQGNVLVEFLFAFPIFMTLCLFSLEVSLSMADKHIVKIAALEAARVYASANLPEFTSEGNPINDPCKAPIAIENAKIAAVKKITAIAPATKLLAAKLKFSSLFAPPAGDPTLQANPNPGNESALGRFAKRWASAAVLTSIKCQYSDKDSVVKVEVSYNRVLETPIINRIIFYLRQLQVAQMAFAPLGFDYETDPFVMSVKTVYQTPEVLQKFKDSTTSILNTLTQLGANSTQSLGVIQQDPFLSSLVNSIVKLPSTIDQGLADSVNAQSTLLTMILATVPEALWTLPLKSTASMPRDFFEEGSSFDGNKIQHSDWKGHLTGAMVFEGDYRTWGKELSNPSQNIRNGIKL